MRNWPHVICMWRLHLNPYLGIISSRISPAVNVYIYHSRPQFCKQRKTRSRGTVESGNSIDKGVRAVQLSRVCRFACENDFLVDRCRYWWFDKWFFIRTILYEHRGSKRSKIKNNPSLYLWHKVKKNTIKEQN